MKDELVLRNVNLIYSALKRLGLYNRCDEFFDVGMIGLIKGANKYDKSLGYSESTYLYRCIYNALLMEIRKKSSGRRIPDYKTTSLSSVIEDNITLEDIIPDDLDIEEDLVKKEQINQLMNEVSNLSKDEQRVINYTFGINGYDEMRQTDIADLMELSQAQVSRIKNRALKKLRKVITK